MPCYGLDFCFGLFCFGFVSPGGSTQTCMGMDVYARRTTTTAVHCYGLLGVSIQFIVCGVVLRCVCGTDTLCKHDSMHLRVLCAKILTCLCVCVFDYYYT